MTTKNQHHLYQWKKYIFIFLFSTIFLSSAYNQNSRFFTNSRDYNLYLSQKESDFTLNEDKVTFNLYLAAPPDMGGDIRGGGITGIGRELPVDDSVWLLLLFPVTYLLNLIVKKKHIAHSH